MLSSIRKFSTSFMGKIVIGLIAIAFIVGFGMSGSFSGKQNIVAEINDEKISTQEFVNYLRTVNITYEEMEKVGKLNLLERVLTNYISEKIVAIESNKMGFQLSDRSLFRKLANDKKFQKDGEFSETRYEKFILTNGLTKPFYESLLKENEIKSQLLNFYSGGLNLPKFIIDDLYKEENRSIDIEFISLTKIYEKKIVKEEEIVSFFEKNKDSFEETRKKFRYLTLSPEVLVGDKLINENYFKKIDIIENAILDGESFDQLTSEYKPNIKNTPFINQDGLKSDGNLFKDLNNETLNEIFKISDLDTPVFVNQNNNFYIAELKESKNEILNLESVGLKEKIVNQIKLIDQIEKISKLINDIEENTFKKDDFTDFANKNNAQIKNLTLKNIDDTSKLNSKSLKRIFELKSGSIFVLPDENENYLMTIVNEKIPKIDINSKSYKNYQNKAKELYTAKIYKSYDSYINQKYKIDIKKNVLKRIENSF